jgi:hypothetical protein
MTFFSPFRQSPKSRQPQRKRATLRLTVEQLEDRAVPTTVTYYPAPSGLTVAGWQGIRNSDISEQYLICGTSGDYGLLLDGTIAGAGASYTLKYPGSKATSVYGPDNQGGDMIGLVGTYRNPPPNTSSVEVHGFLYQGEETVAALSDASNYYPIDVPGATFNYVHSTMGGLAVGNYDSPVDHNNHHLPAGPGHAFLYDVQDPSHIQFLTDIVFPHSHSNTAYGIWYNGGTSYTICGGYSFSLVNNFDEQNRPLGHGYLVDYNSATGRFSNWASFDFPGGNDFLTHFEGISSVENGVYTLSADSVQRAGNGAQGSWVAVRRNPDGSFGQATWVDLNYTPLPADFQPTITSSDSVYGNQVVGIVLGQDNGKPSSFAFQATVNLGSQRLTGSSGNSGDGMALDHAAGSQIAMSYIGAEVTGTPDRGNAQNGIQGTAGSERNLLDGEAGGGDAATHGVFVQPPKVHLILGNDVNGVLLTSHAHRNQLSGNFPGTDATGDAALGNGFDGVRRLMRTRTN